MDRATGVARLAAGTVDVVIVAPDDPDTRFAAGEQSVIEVETQSNYDGSALRDLEMVRAVHQVDATHLRVTVDDAATALPDVVEVVTSFGADVVSARESRPSFDAVFTTLVQRDRDARAADEASAAANADTDTEAA